MLVQLLKKLRGYYQSCTDEETLDSIGSEPLLQITRHIRALFPISPHPTEGHGDQAVLRGPKFVHDLTAVLAYLHSIGEFLMLYYL